MTIKVIIMFNAKQQGVAAGLVRLDITSARFSSKPCIAFSAS